MNRILCIITKSVIILGLIGIVTSCLFRNPRILQYPIRASCNLTWYFEQDCPTVTTKLMDQIKNWETSESCGTRNGQKCLYKLLLMDGNQLKASHENPTNHKIDDMMFTFYPNPSTGGCNIIGFSTTREWHNILDDGRNYCNLYHLVEGAGLRLDPKFTEITRDEFCTGYTGARCDKY